jgi:hypothetical protein
VLDRGGLTISWLEALKNLGTEAAQESEIATDAASSSEDEFSESLTQQGDKGAKSLAPLPFWHLCHPLTLGILTVTLIGKGAERRIFQRKGDLG